MWDLTVHDRLDSPQNSLSINYYMGNMLYVNASGKDLHIIYEREMDGSRYFNHLKKNLNCF